MLAVVGALSGQQSKPIHANENDGVLQGTVTYEDGKSVKGATVYAQP